MRLFKRKGRKGFTLVEIMIVVAIIGLLAAIAIPNFVKARQKAQQNACIANLKQIDGAKQVYALDNNTPDTQTPGWSGLVTNYIKKTPECKAGGVYTVDSINTDPACDQGGHQL